MTVAEGGSSLSGRVALVSGGAGDIGLAVARALSHAGARVYVGDLLTAGTGRRRLADAGLEGVGYHQLDVRDAGAVRRWVDDVAATAGEPTVAVPAAATVTVAGLMEITAQQWSDELRVNLDGALHLATAVVRRLTAAGLGGHVVFVGSWAADRPHPHVPAYAASKAALRMLCRCLALEVAAAGIYVNEVAPGLVDAGLSGQVLARDEALRRSVAAGVPARRLLSANEVAAEVLRLCTTTTMIGTTVLVDGGASLTSLLQGGQP